MPDIGISFTLITADTPTVPDAKRGAVSEKVVTETSEQLADNLIWWQCSFCGRLVLVLVYGRGERCRCGAKRFNRKAGEGWKRGDKEWWFA